jgi:hypothetical protein
VARDYLLLALRLDQHLPGVVDAYFGPADLKAQTELEPERPPAVLAADAAVLRDRLPAEIGDDARRDWLELQLRALETQASVLAGRTLPYVEQVERCFAWTPVRRDDSLFDAAAAELDALLPGDGSLDGRLRAMDAGWTLPVDAARDVVDRLVARFRAGSERAFGLPDGEDVRVAFVRDQPWSGYDWFDGGGRSRVDLNTDLPLRLPALLSTVAHETYPGHHLEHAWKERTLVEERRHLEASVLTINTPECLISEGLANLGRELVLADDQVPALLEELARVAGLPVAADEVALREAAERAPRVAAIRKVLDATRVNAALLRHADGRSHDEVLDYLVTVGRFARETAAKRLEFIEHPMWRTYVFVYTEGEELLRRWLDAAPPERRVDRFGRLLREPLTPVAIAAQLAGGAAG